MTPIETLARVRDGWSRRSARAQRSDRRRAGRAARARFTRATDRCQHRQVDAADELADRSGGVYFQWLLTKFTTPEEIFGAVS
jgi:hypothetical protein